MLLFGLIVMQILAFGIVIYILKKIMVGDTESAVNRLDQSYAEVNKKKEELVAKMQELEKDYKKRKSEAEKVAADIKDTIEKDASNKRDELLKRSRADGEKIVTEALEMREKIGEEIRKEEMVKIADYCGELLNKTLKDVIKGDVDIALINNFLQELETVDVSHVPPSVSEAEIVSAEKLNDDAKAKIISMLEKKLNRKLAIKDSVDPTLIGGAAIKFGSLNLDGSIMGRVKENITARKFEIEART